MTVILPRNITRTVVRPVRMGSDRPRGHSYRVSAVMIAAMTVFFVLNLWFASPVQAADPPAIPFELQAYRVCISVAFADSPSLEPELRKSVMREVGVTADRLLGEMWTVKTEENQWLLPTSAELLAQLTPEQLPDNWLTETQDKTFLVTLEHVGGEYVLSGREWDHVGRTLGRPRLRRIAQRRDLAMAIFRLTHDLFRPLFSIDQIDAGVASFTVKAGALTPADPSCVQLKSQQFWQPFMRYRNSLGKVEKWQEVPWTMLQVDEVSSKSTARGQAKVVSGLRSVLPARRRARVEAYARLLEPQATETTLRLVSRQNTSHPLVGVVVEAKVKPDDPTTRYLTDRDGSVRIPAIPEVPLQWLYVRSGDKTLARLPLVPGLERIVQAELPDDSIRLRVEGELSILEANLTDTVAQRAVIMARIRKFVQFNDWKPVAGLKRDLRLLPGPDYYLKELNAIRIPARQAALTAKDKSTAAYIDRVCNESSVVIQKFLDDDKLREFEDELKGLEKSPAIRTKPAEKPAEKK